MSTTVEKYIDIITSILVSKCPEHIKNKVAKNYLILANAVLNDENSKKYGGLFTRLVINDYGFVEVEHVVNNGIPFLDSVHTAIQELVDIANTFEEQFEIPYNTINDQLPSAEEIDISFE